MEYAVCPSPETRDWRPYRGAVRYPLHLRVTLLVEDRQYEAVTEDLSASGALLRLGEPLEPGQPVEFLVEIPAGALESSVTAALHCSGRVIRSWWNNGEAFAATVIDDYQFQ